MLTLAIVRDIYFDENNVTHVKIANKHIALMMVYGLFYLALLSTIFHLPITRDSKNVCIYI
jgi:hypothetical protein